MSMKVLIAEADWRFARQAAEYLESHAHLVVCESRPPEAAAHAAHWQPDLIILAADLAQQGLMQAIYQLHPRPAVLLTGSMHRYDVAWKAWQKGGDELLMKPVFRTAELQSAIVTAMENAVTGRRARKTITASA